MDNNTVETTLLEPNPEIKKLSRKIWDETKIILRISLPSMLFRLSTFGVFIVTQSFIGHIDSVYLAAYALVQSISLRFINGIVGHKPRLLYLISSRIMPLAFLLDGIWIGMLVGMVTQLTSLVILTWRINWEEEVEKTKKRLGRFYHQSSERSNRSSDPE
ncbi:hypothetical protein V2J09_012403 [Rumex salicifolius]